MICIIDHNAKNALVPLVACFQFILDKFEDILDTLQVRQSV